MSVEIKGDDVVFTIPNSEAIIDVQRTAIKSRSVCSYYLSNIQDDVEKSLNGLVGNFYIDLLYSFTECEQFLLKVMDTSGNLYRNDLFCLKKVLDDVRWLKNTYPHQLFFKCSCPVILASRKYLKIPGDSDLMNKFRTMCLGDLTEIHFQRLSTDTFRIFVKPRKDMKLLINNKEEFNKYLTSIRKAA